jgi:HK97 gp10 family phage protein
MKISNVDRLKRKLRAMPQAVKDEIRIALMESADEITDLAQSFVPVRTGALRDSIRWRFGDVPGNRKAVLVGKTTLGGHELSVTIEAGDEETYWARFVEFGTAASPARAPRQDRRYRRTVIMTKSYKAHHATPARPFFYPAFRLGKKRAKARISRAITRAAKKVAASG